MCSELLYCSRILTIAKAEFIPNANQSDNGENGGDKNWIQESMFDSINTIDWLLKTILAFTGEHGVGLCLMKLTICEIDLGEHLKQGKILLIVVLLKFVE